MGLMTSLSGVSGQFFVICCLFLFGTCHLHIDGVSLFVFSFFLLFLMTWIFWDWDVQAGEDGGYISENMWRL